MKHFQRYPLKYVPQRAAISAKATAKLLYFKPQYLFLAAIMSVVFYEIIYWFLNLGLFRYLLTTEFLPLLAKVQLIISSYTSIFEQPYSPMAITLFVVSVLQGAAIAGIVYSIRRERSINKSAIKDLGGTGAAGVLSVLGLGCAACGTSLIAPILALFFAASSAALAEQIGFYSAVLALIVSVITIYISGYKLSAKLPF